MKKYIYFVQQSVISISCLPRITKSAFYQNVPTSILENFLRKIWKNQKLQTFEKKFLFLFNMNCYMDKQEKWLKQLTPHPLCFLCDSEFETWNDLFNCAITLQLRTYLQITKWDQVWKPNNYLAQKFVVSIILSPWSEEEGKYLAFMKQRCIIKN